MGSAIDIAGQRFGRLVAIERIRGRRGLSSKWLCRCDCGNTTKVSTTYLINGVTKSCKCLWKLKGRKNKRWRGFGDISGFHLRVIMTNAKNRGHSFDVTVEFLWDLFLKQGKKCALTGLPIAFDDKSASLDRIDSNIGYTESNVQWVDKRINRMKNTYSQEEFIMLCTAVANNYRRKRRDGR